MGAEMAGEAEARQTLNMFDIMRALTKHGVNVKGKGRLTLAILYLTGDYGIEHSREKRQTRPEAIIKTELRNHAGKFTVEETRLINDTLLREHQTIANVVDVLTCGVTLNDIAIAHMVGWGSVRVHLDLLEYAIPRLSYEQVSIILEDLKKTGRKDDILDSYADLMSGTQETGFSISDGVRLWRSRIRGILLPLWRERLNVGDDVPDEWVIQVAFDDPDTITRFLSKADQVFKPQRDDVRRGCRNEE